MKIISILFCILWFNSFLSYSQVGIGIVNPHPSAMLEVSSTNSGVLIPRLTQAERLAITSPATGLLIYQTDNTTGFWYFNGTIWTNFAGTTTGWSIIGNSGNIATDYLGTSDANDFAIKTNNTEAIRVQQTTGNIGINTSNPTHKLHIVGNNPVFRLEDGLQNVGKVITSDANGNAYWGDSSGLVFTGTSYDWNFQSGSTYADPIYHWGPTVIGKTGTTIHHLDIDNGTVSGTTFGIGDIEVISDGNNEIIFNQNFVPITDNTAGFSLGKTTNQWNTLYSANGVLTTSDRNQKKNIESLEYGLEELLKLNPVSYYWKKEIVNSNIVPEDKKQLKLGFLAQEVEKIIPEVVYTHSYKQITNDENQPLQLVKNETLGINYEELLPVLVKAKQEQDEMIIELQNEVSKLSKQLLDLTKK